MNKQITLINHCPLVSKSQIKIIKSLNLQKFRQKYDKFTAEGEKTVTEFVKHVKYPVDQVFTDEPSVWDRLSNYVSEHQLVLVSKTEMAQMSLFKTPSNVLAVFNKKENAPDIKRMVNQKILFLDDIQDPGNLGTMIRIADWFGIHHVVRSPGSADFYHPKVIQATMGSLCNVETYTCTLKELITFLPGIPVLGAVLQEKLLQPNVTLPQAGILVIGNEGHGIHPENLPLITIPMRIKGHQNKVAESLNAASACSIICYHWTAEAL